MSEQTNHIEFELVRRAQHGELNAFEELVKLHDRSVLNVAYSMTGNADDAQDVYQETFLRAYTGISRFRFESSFRTWVMRIAVNQSINMRKKRRLRSFLSLNVTASEHDEPVVLQIADSEDPTAEVVSEEILQQVQMALKVLTTKERAVFTLKHFEQYKVKEIAQMLNCAEGTVKNYLFRATQKLQARLKSYYRN